MRRIKEIREKEPEREIVYTDETWRNALHKVEREWVDEEALKNPSKSLKDYGTVGCTKEKIGKGKRLIVVDCITESGPVPGALWIFSETKSKKKGKQQFNMSKLLLKFKEQWSSERKRVKRRKPK